MKYGPVLVSVSILTSLAGFTRTCGSKAKSLQGDMSTNVQTPGCRQPTFSLCFLAPSTPCRKKHFFLLVGAASEPLFQLCHIASSALPSLLHFIPSSLSSDVKAAWPTLCLSRGANGSVDNRRQPLLPHGLLLATPLLRAALGSCGGPLDHSWTSCGGNTPETPGSTPSVRRSS